MRLHRFFLLLILTIGNMGCTKKTNSNGPFEGVRVLSDEESPITFSGIANCDRFRFSSEELLKNDGKLIPIDRELGIAILSEFSRGKPCAMGLSVEFARLVWYVGDTPAGCVYFYPYAYEDDRLIIEYDRSCFIIANGIPKLKEMVSPDRER